MKVTSILRSASHRVAFASAASTRRFPNSVSPAFSLTPLPNSGSSNGTRKAIADTKMTNRKKAELIHELTCGFMTAEALAFSVRTNVFGHLARKPQTGEELAPKLKLHSGALHRLLRHLSVLGLLHQDGNVFSVTDIGLLLSDNQRGNLASLAILRSEEAWWKPWRKLSHSIKTGRAAFSQCFGVTFYNYLAKHADLAKQFHDRMDAETRRQVLSLRRFIDLSEAKSVVDVGGSYGALIAGLITEKRRWRGVLFDRDEVINIVQQSNWEVANHCEAISGDFFQKMPQGDVLLLKGVLHDWDDAKSIRILKNCAKSIQPGGRLYVIERTVSDESESILPTLFDLHMLVMSGGRERTLDEFATLFFQAGLVITRAKMDSETGLMVMETRKLTRKQTAHRKTK